MTDDIAQIPDDELRAALHGSRAANEYLRDQLTSERDRSSRFVNDLCDLIPDDRDDDVAAEAIVIDWVKELLADRDRARDAAVALEQENARLAERIVTAVSAARARDEELLAIRDRRSGQGDHRLAGELERAAHEVRMIADALEGGEAS